MRIVMPLFEFCFDDADFGREYEFLGGKYKLIRFDANHEIPPMPGISELDRAYMEKEHWALLAQDPVSERYKEEVNLLLLSFKIFRLSPVFIAYRLCKEDENQSTRLFEPIKYHLYERPSEPLTRGDLDEVNEGFIRLLEMLRVSHRTHNAIYFTYRGLSCYKMIDSFALLTMAIESLFSPDTRGGVTKAICSRVSAFLGPSDPRSSADMHKLYGLRSRIVHGRVVVEDDIKGKVRVLHDLQRVLLKCLKKMLTERTYDVYRDDSKKEEYFKKLVGDAMTCHVCGGQLNSLVTTLPVKEDRDRIIIIKGVPLLQCDNCREYVIEDAVMDKIDVLLSKVDATAELEVLNYAM